MFIEAVNALTPTTPTIPTGAVVAIFSAYLMDFLKRLNSLPKVTYFSTKLNAWIRVALSGVGTLGVSWSWSSHWSWSGAGAAMITIPAGSVLAIGCIIGGRILHHAFQRDHSCAAASGQSCDIGAIGTKASIEGKQLT